METIRRLYLYLAAFVALMAALAALPQLVHLVLDALFGASAFTPAGVLREQVSQQVGILVVAVPLWAAHWWLAARRRPTTESARSGLHHLYLYAVIAVALLVGAVNAGRLLGDVLRLALGDEPAVGSVVARLLWAMTGLLLAGWHSVIARQSRASAGESVGAAWARRWYTYAACAAGAAVALVGVVGLIHLVWDVTTEQLWTATAVWDLGGARRRLVIMVPAVMAGAIVWLTHWRWALAWAPQPSAAPRAELASGIRRLFLLVASLAPATISVTWASLLLYRVLQVFFGTGPGGEAAQLVTAAFHAATWAIVFGATWGYHGTTLRRETRQLELHDRQPSPLRLARAFLVLVGLTLVAIGVEQLLRLLLDTLFGAGDVAAAQGWWVNRTSRAITLVVAGAPLWLVPWLGVQIRQPPVAELRSLSRRGILYFALFAAVIALLAGGSTTLFTLVRWLLEGTLQANILRESLAIVLVATVVGLYHLRVVRRDQAALPAEAPVAREPLIILRSGESADVVSELNRLQRRLKDQAKITVLSVAPAFAEQIMADLAAEGSDGSPGGTRETV
ncbi:MAG: hypothetical protein CL878_13980 [Dehalococcoidia bacterium]|nr:hypothetical protein [Dehalococcoidia bacterium]